MTSEPASPPRVTIITPTYNQAPFLADCLRSVLAQDVADWEQVVVDDGSTDDTQQVLDGFTDPRIRKVRQDNVGIQRLAHTYNRALAMARGEFVAILEGDDAWPPHALSTLLQAAQADPSAVMAFGLAELVRDGRRTGETIPSQQGRRWLGPALGNRPIGSALLAMATFQGRTFTFPCAVLLRREVLEDVGGFQQPEGVPFVDLPTFMQVAARGPFSFVPEVVGLWRVHPASATRNRDEVAVHRLLARHAADVLHEHGPRLGLGQDAIATALGSWEAAEPLVRYELAKSHLLSRRWGPARAGFGRVLRQGPAPLRWRAAAGWVLATLHRRPPDRSRWRRRPGP